MSGSLRWVPQDGPQRALYECPFDDIFYGGARGGGKTDGLLGKLLKHLIEAEQKGVASRVRGLIIRKHLDEMTALIDRARQIFAPPIAKMNIAKNNLNFANGAVVYFRSLDRDDDATKYQGREFTFLGVEEAGNFHSPRGIDMLFATLRSTAGIKPVCVMTGNPGGAGHNWLKSRYISPSPPMVPQMAPTIGGSNNSISRVFIPAKVSDNKILIQAQPTYQDMIVRSTIGQEWLQRAWLDGDWNVVAGGMFDDLWSDDIHILPKFPIPRQWRIYRAYDWGSAKPFSIGWWAVTDGTDVYVDGYRRIIPAASLIRIAELYGWNGTPDQGLNLTENEIVDRIIYAERNLRVKVNAGPADTNIFQAVSGRRLVDVHNNRGIFWREADKSPGSRVTGWQLIRERLLSAREEYPEEPAMYVFDNCRQFIRTVPSAQRDSSRLEDVDTKTEDHVLDETRYMVLFQPGQLRKMRIGM